MGYTHYYSFNKSKKKTAAQVEKAYQRGIKACSKIIRSYSKQFGGLAGYSAHSDTYGGIDVNGSERTGACENLILREHFSQNEAGNFVKTNNHPYDEVVTACLIVMQHYLGDSFSVGSDGYVSDWDSGFTLAQRTLKLKTLKTPIGNFR